MAARLVWKGQQAISRIKRAQSRGVEKAGRMFIEECVRLMFESKSGRVYPDGHRASAPGEPPASHHGTLINRFQLVVKDMAKGEVARVTNKAKHHPMLESGTPRMLPRPLFSAALANPALQQSILKTVRDELTAEFRKK